MNKMPTKNLAWGKEIVFIVDPKDLLPIENKEFHKVKLFEDCSFATEDGCELPSHNPPTHASPRYKYVNPDTLLPGISLIDFNETPTRCCVLFMLQNYVSSHIRYE